MNDHFLKLHSVATRHYAIAGQIAPISIRDQVVRAEMFVSRALEQEIISPQKPLLIAGAGIGGVTASICAAAAEVPVTVLDRRELPFHLQRGCTTRWIDPTLYDWPAHHWSEARYPWISSQYSRQIGVIAGPCNLIAAGWAIRFDEARVKFRGTLDFIPSTKLINPGIDLPNGLRQAKCRRVTPAENDLPEEERRGLSRDYDAQAIQSGDFVPVEYSALLDARGFGLEKTTCGRYRSLAFWDTDPFQIRNFNLGNPPRGHRWKVLICGGGDGALQDFLRIVTGQQSTADLIGRVEAIIPSYLLRELITAEDQAFRAKIWNGKESDHATCTALDAVHDRVIRSVLGSKQGRGIRKTVLKLVEFSDKVEVTLAHKCSHFTATYPVNRFLVRLIASVVSDRIKIAPNTSLLSVECQHGNPSPWRCIGKAHKVGFESFDNCRATQSPCTSKPPSETYDIVVLRIGLSGPNPLDVLGHLAPQRHPIPFYSPSESAD